MKNIKMSLVVVGIVIFAFLIGCGNRKSVNSETSYEDVTMQVTTVSTTSDTKIVSNVTTTSVTDLLTSTNISSSSSSTAITTVTAVNIKEVTTILTTKPVVAETAAAKDNKKETKNSIVLNEIDAYGCVVRYLSDPYAHVNITSCENVEPARLIDGYYYYIIAHYRNNPSFFAVDAETGELFEAKISNGFSVDRNSKY